MVQYDIAKTIFTEFWIHSVYGKFYLKLVKLR
jgi:hypothetical protein